MVCVEDISDDTGLCNYICNDCGNKFAGVIVKNLKCSECHSTNTKIMFEEEIIRYE